MKSVFTIDNNHQDSPKGDSPCYTEQQETERRIPPSFLYFRSSSRQSYQTHDSSLCKALPNTNQVIKIIVLISDRTSVGSATAGASLPRADPNTQRVFQPQSWSERIIDATAAALNLRDQFLSLPELQVDEVDRLPQHDALAAALAL